MAASAEAAIRAPLAPEFVCSHRSPGEPRARTDLYEWRDGEITMTIVRRGRPDTA